MQRFINFRPTPLRRFTTSRRWLTNAWLLSIACLLSCARGQQSHLGGTELTGSVTERAEGYSQRPDWADANQPWSRLSKGLRVVGYVAIRGDQRKDVGYRAADSYARAELVRFLSVRIVSVLEDQVKTGEPEVLRERIEVTARSLVDDMTVAQRYFERRKTGNEERLHIWSRLDIDQATVLELLQRATRDATDFRTPTVDLVRKLTERWETFTEVRSLNQGDPMLPTDVAQPPWAKGGDRVTNAGFQFVCHGLAKDEKTARALAQSSCNEKLCRLFGVQISAKTKVVENLDGVTAESEVSEQCVDVRAVGREVRYQGGECGPHGCVQWILQNYPRAAYEEEKKRLDQPTIIRQEVVIQEGGKVYRDPAACEASLRAYGAVTGLSAPAFEQRNQQLKRAMQVCQGIDGRDSGLFLALNNLLTTPLSNFTVESPNSRDGFVSNTRLAFVVAAPEWRKNLETQRFLTDRISAVLKLVSDAIVPMRILDLRDQGGDEMSVDRVIREIIKYPFVNTPASPHHWFYMHDLALSLVGSKRIAFSQRYRTYLLEQGAKANLECSGKVGVAGERIITYLGSDGLMDEQEWQLGMHIVVRSAPNTAGSCVTALWYKQNQGANRAQRLEQVAGMIASGEIKTKDSTQTFASFLRHLEKDERAPLYFKYRSQLSGSQQARAQIVESVVRDSFGWNWDWEREKKVEGRQQCEAMPRRIGSLFAEIPEARTKDTGLCLCLRLEGVAPAARQAIGELLFRYGDEKCDWIRPEDWPGGYYDVPEPKYLASDGRTPFSGHISFLEPEFKQCVAEHLTIEGPTVVTLLSVSIASGRYSRVTASTTLAGQLKNFSYRGNRRGFVRKSDLELIQRSIESCIVRSAEGFRVPDLYPITKESKVQRLWFQYWGSNVGGFGFVE